MANARNRHSSTPLLVQPAVYSSGDPCGRHASHNFATALLLATILAYILFSVVQADYTSSPLPFARDFRWPHVTTHTALAQRFIDMIPPTASVSAQTRLVPHLSQRLNIYLFPYADDRADYVFLDVTGDRYPYFDAQAYNREVQKVSQSGNYGILAAQDGYLLLKRGLPSRQVNENAPTCT